MRKNWNGEEIKQGDTIFVEVKKGPIGDKGAVVSMDYSLRGKDLVLLPMSNGIKISNKIENRDTIRRLLEWGESSSLTGGLIFRTSSKDISRLEYNSQLEQLNIENNRLIRERNFLPTPKLILSESPLEKFLLNRKDYPMVINNKYIFKKIRQFSGNNIFFDPDFSIRGDAFFRKQFDKIFSRIIYLENGGNIFIDKTEALTVIDVNSAHAKNARDFEEYAYETNLLAAKEIMQQIRLRNISGMVVIDFLRNEIEENRKSIIEIFKEGMSEDKLRSNIFGFSSMGLFELNRQRERPLFSYDYNLAIEKNKKDN